MSRTLTPLLACLVAAPAWAQTTITWDPQATQGMDTAALEQELGVAIDENLRIGDIDAYMASMANAAAISSRGMGVDYASNPDIFVLGGSFGVGGHAAGFPPSTGDGLLPEAGFATQLSVMAGLSLGVFTKEDTLLDRLRIYAHGMSLDAPGGGDFEGSLTNVGANLQFQALTKRSLADAVEWGGLAITSGAELSSYSMTLVAPLPVEGGSATWNAEGSYDISASALTVPVELSTNLRVLVANVYAGGALDFQPGSAEGSVGLSGPIEVDVNGNSVEAGTATVAASGSGQATAMAPRVFAGAQIELLVVKLYGHLNLAANNAAGAHLGLRIAI